MYVVVWAHTRQTRCSCELARMLIDQVQQLLLQWKHTSLPKDVMNLTNQVHDNCNGFVQRI